MTTTTPRRLSCSSPWLALATAALLAAPAAAQEAEAKSPTGPLGIGQTINVTFRGGSLADYVSVIRNAGEKINIVMPPSAADVQIPPLSIVDAEVEAALEVAAQIADEGYQVGVRNYKARWGLPIYVLQVRKVRTGNTGPTTVGPGEPPAIVRVFSLANLTERLPGDPDDSDLRVKAETVLTAVDAGLAVAPDEGAPKPVIRFHKDSGLLFVRGTPQQTALVGNIIEQMERDVERRRATQRAQQAQRLQQAQPPGPSGPVDSKKASR